MKTNQKDRRSQGTKTGEKQNQSNKAKSSSNNVRKNEDISTADRAEEPAPTKVPQPNPDLPPNPSRREYEDPGHEHIIKDPSAAYYSTRL